MRLNCCTTPLYVLACIELTPMKFGINLVRLLGEAPILKSFHRKLLCESCDLQYRINQSQLFGGKIDISLGILVLDFSIEFNCILMENMLETRIYV